MSGTATSSATPRIWRGRERRGEEAIFEYLCQSKEWLPIHTWRRTQEERVKLDWNFEGNPPGDGELNLSADELAGLEQDGLIL